MKKVLITGISGFIASKLAERLVKNGCEIFGLTSSGTQKMGTRSPNYKIFQVDLAKEDLGIEQCFVENKFDAVIHLASFSDYTDELSKLEDYISVNLTYPTKLLKLMLKHGSKNFINTSSYWQYDAEGKSQANSLYAASKIAFKEVLEYFSQNNDGAIS